MSDTTTTTTTTTPIAAFNPMNRFVTFDGLKDYDANLISNLHSLGYNNKVSGANIFAWGNNNRIDGQNLFVFGNGFNLTTNQRYPSLFLGNGYGLGEWDGAEDTIFGVWGPLSDENGPPVFRVGSESGKQIRAGFNIVPSGAFSAAWGNFGVAWDGSFRAADGKFNVTPQGVINATSVFCASNEFTPTEYSPEYIYFTYVDTNSLKFESQTFFLPSGVIRIQDLNLTDGTSKDSFYLFTSDNYLVQIGGAELRIFGNGSKPYLSVSPLTKKHQIEVTLILALGREEINPL